MAVCICFKYLCSFHFLIQQPKRFLFCECSLWVIFGANLSERNAGASCWSLHRLQLFQKRADAPISSWIQENVKLFLPDVSRSVLQGVGTVQGRPPMSGDAGSRGEDPGVRQRRGQQLSHTQMEPVGLQDTNCHIKSSEYLQKEVVSGYDRLWPAGGSASSEPLVLRPSPEQLPGL